MRIRQKYWIQVFSVIVSLLFMAGGSPAHAHKVNVFAWVEGNTVHTESKFHGGRPAKNAPLDVLDLNGEKLLEGKTDDKGAFSFTAPRKTAMKIVLRAGMGHQGEWTIPVEEFGQSGVVEEQEQRAVITDQVRTEPLSQSTKVGSARTGENEPCLTQEAVALIVEKELDKKIKPIMEKLNRLLDPHKEPSVSDIMGGIGYILGLVGLVAYFQSRKEKK